LNVPSTFDKILEVISNTPEWKIKVRECFIFLNRCYPQVPEIDMYLEAKVYDEIIYLSGCINDETLDIKFCDINYIGFNLSFHTVHNYPVESARIFAVAFLAKALQNKYRKVVDPYIQAENQRGRVGIYTCIPPFCLYPSLDEPYAEGWAYLHYYFTKTNFCTLRFIISVRPRQPEVTIYCHPHGFGNYADVNSYTTDIIEEAFNLIPKLVALYFI
jgi:hypothetical protein